MIFVPYFAYTLDQVTFFLRARVPAGTPKLPVSSVGDAPAPLAGAKRTSAEANGPAAEPATDSRKRKSKADASATAGSAKRSKTSDASDATQGVVMAPALDAKMQQAVATAQARAQLAELVVSAIMKCLLHDTEKFLSRDTLQKFIKPLTHQLDIGASPSLRLPRTYRHVFHFAPRVLLSLIVAFGFVTGGMSRRWSCLVWVSLLRTWYDCLLCCTVVRTGC